MQTRPDPESDWTSECCDPWDREPETEAPTPGLRPWIVAMAALGVIAVIGDFVIGASGTNAAEDGAIVATLPPSP